MFSAIAIQVLANFLSAPLVAGQDGEGCPFVAFDLDPSVVKVHTIIDRLTIAHSFILRFSSS